MKELIPILVAVLLIIPCQCWTNTGCSQRLSSLPALRSRGVRRCAMVHSSDANDDHDLLIRAYKGEDVHRTPVWLMRQVISFSHSPFHGAALLESRTFRHRPDGIWPIFVNFRTNYPFERALRLLKLQWSCHCSHGADLGLTGSFSSQVRAYS